MLIFDQKWILLDETDIDGVCMLITSSLVYVLSVMKQNSSNRGALISSYFLQQ